jgi:hypothetical protein
VKEAAIMTGLDPALVDDLRNRASSGQTVPELLRVLVQRLGPDAASRTLLAKYFMEAFRLPLRFASPIGGWSPDNRGEISDEALQEMVYPHIIETRDIWSTAHTR